MVAEALKMALVFDGYDVRTAESGHEALAIFQVGKFDLILTDFEMPGMNGHHLASVTKAQDPGQLVVMITAYADMVTCNASPAC